MAKKKMFRQLIMPFTLLITISLIVLTWFSFSSLKSFYLEETRKNLLSKSQLFQPQVIPILDEGQSEFAALQELCKRVGNSSKTRITVILPNGVVVGDSEKEPDKMDNHKFRNEVAKALSGKIGHSIRYSNTLQRSMMYLAVPLEHENRLIGVLRLSVTTEAIDLVLDALLIKLALAFLVIALLAGFTAFVISKRISQPLEQLKIGAERFAQGDFANQLAIPDSEEISKLAEAMNYMAAELDRRIKVITLQRNEQEAILQSMIEGVMAIDKSENILIMNKAAGDLLGVNPFQSKGKSVYEVIRIPEIHDIIRRTLQSNSIIEGELSLSFETEINISYISSILGEASGSTIGALLVFNDITRLRHLETLRQDFVANVSHELRTPITSIKGFVETLSDGAIENKEDSKRFLGIIEKQANRLNAIIDDLLSLANIEQNEKNNEISLQEECLYEIIRSAVEVCQIKVAEKEIEIKVECDQDLIAKLNAPLMQQALVNLIDNAIKYSPAGGQIMVRALAIDNRLEISVHDRGQGIDKRHFPRLFERFYVIDKARSRELGGTGLGLAIVKHIVSANQGTVKVESEPGKGSVFTIEIPVTD